MLLLKNGNLHTMEDGVKKGFDLLIEDGKIVFSTLDISGEKD